MTQQEQLIWQDILYRHQTQAEETANTLLQNGETQVYMDMLMNDAWNKASEEFNSVLLEMQLQED